MTVAPFMSLLSVTLNQIGMEWGFWTLYPEADLLIFNSIYIDFGYNPSAAILFIYMIYVKKLKRYAVYLGFILFLNGAEILAQHFEKVVYSNDWNIFYTFLAYVIGLIVLDLYYFLLTRSISKRNLS
nr:CBO0543 family protein [Thalassobacillus sp. CUG 92003]